MGNFFTDNEDMQFLFDHMDVEHLASLVEDDFSYAREFDFAPRDAAEAVDNYKRILKIMGDLCANEIAPTAEETDEVGNVLNPDGSVTYAPGIANALKILGQADTMGMTLPYRFGGINCPQLMLTAANEMISRADAALMNIYGLQGIAETINAFASEEIKQEFLPDLASGAHTGAMVLTEPDAGSDLQAVKTMAYQDDDGNWFVHGVKRFITNGCGEVLLVLARTEPEISDGRGLSLLVCERGPKVKIRRLENKLGIHGSPTCEIFFDHVPAQLIGERQRGLITYVMSLMNGARIGIAAQGLGIGEAAYRVARDYGHSRKQYDTEIENFPAVRELLVNMSMDVQAARAITYFATASVDIENYALRRTELGEGAELDAETRKELKQLARRYKNINKLLTPMAKYYASEMSMRVSNDSMAVLGGSGYMKDYAVQRHLRDSRITTIYEGTSQLQVVAAGPAVIKGTAHVVVEDILAKHEWTGELKGLTDRLRAGLVELQECIDFVKSQGMEYTDLVARKLVDFALGLIIGALFCDYATAKEEKLALAKRWIALKSAEAEMQKRIILSGDRQIIDDFDVLAGPVPVID
jgi:alkylation response protein AidB-like acyl-CoA dehydrogenase